ncbi:hypothetical protein P5673_020901 [Acropora cervicornis]|uniref:Uncharacterized protein n=1 Tax=Acropora cervicornis TaxID=6130 RepID=A0AAD9V0U9_ACRCE|nr:hypothetical protein P5673_020901 [Acropora cervicornis]
MKQALDEADHCLKNYSEKGKPEIVEWKETLREQFEKFVDLSVAILALMEADDTLTEEDLTAELYESNKMKIEVRKRLAAINERLTNDLATQEDDTGMAFALYNGSKDRLAHGGFKLRKWMTNDEEA